MKKILNKLFTGSLLACMVLVSSCAGDYLDTAPTDSTGASDAVGTTANAMKALNGIAKIMTTQQYYFGQGFAGENNIMAHYENYPSENYLYNMYASGWSPIHNQEFHTRTNSIYDAYAWYYYYTIIGNANTILANIDNAEGLQTEKDFVKASALTFRAYAFEKLVHYYCCDGRIPITALHKDSCSVLMNPLADKAMLLWLRRMFKSTKIWMKQLPCITRVVWTVMPHKYGCRM